MSSTNANTAQTELARRNYYKMHADVVLIRIPFLPRTLKRLETVASQTGLSVAEITAILIGPDPRSAVREIIQARDEALADRRKQLQQQDVEEEF